MEKLQPHDNFIENKEPTFWDFKGKYDFVDDWFLMGSPYPLLLITSMYLLFVLKLGPEYLKNRKPFKLRKTILFYNTFQVILSTWMVIQCTIEVRRVGIIQRTCFTDTIESKLRLTSITYYYFACKITELLDTIFFVLRKKDNQVTFLHVYHHTLMVWNSWMFLKYDPGYWAICLGILNCFVHVIMYSYYALSVFPKLQKYLWWKKYITSLQLIQFAIILVQATINFFVSECKPSRIAIGHLYFNLLLFIYLFSSFYNDTYNKQKKIDATKNNKNSLNQETFKNGINKKHKTTNVLSNGISKVKSN